MVIVDLKKSYVLYFKLPRTSTHLRRNLSQFFEMWTSLDVTVNITMLDRWKKCEFSGARSLKKHIHTIHEGHKDYKCEFWSNKTDLQLNELKKIQTNWNDRWFSKQFLYVLLIFVLCNFPIYIYLKNNACKHLSKLDHTLCTNLILEIIVWDMM